MEHPAESQREWILGLVTAVHADTWEVDVRPVYGTSGVVRRCKILGTYLPEVHTDERQSKIVFGRLDANQQSPVAIPVHNTMIPDDQRASHVFWSEHLAFRTTITRDGVLEIRNQKGDLLQLRILEEGGVVELRTPSTDVVLREADKSVTIDAAEAVTINCKSATVNAVESATVIAGASIRAQAGGSVTVQAGGNAAITAAGNVDVTGALINLNGV